MAIPCANMRVCVYYLFNWFKGYGMNGKILQITIEAIAYAYSVTDKTTYNNVWEASVTTKFAELLLQECFNTLYNNGYDDALATLQENFK